MSYYRTYLNRLIGGNVKILRSNLSPGHIVSFKYKTEATGRKLPRLILVLGKFNKGGMMLLHGITLENIPEMVLYSFLKRVIIKDTLSLIKRKYELKGPFSQLIDRPKSFYIKYIKPNLMEYDCYRTYKLNRITQVNCWMLDWKKLKVFNNTTHETAIIGKNESLVEIDKSKKILNEIIGADISKINNATFNKIIKERFGTMNSFYEMLGDLENYMDESMDDNKDGFNSTKY